MFLEPAILLATGVGTEEASNGVVALSCITYGEPTPSVQWSVESNTQSSLISDASEGFSIASVEITTNFERYSIQSRVSILLVCDGTAEDLSEITCSVDNDQCVTDAVGYQIAKFHTQDNFSTEFFRKEVHMLLLFFSTYVNQLHTQLLSHNLGIAIVSRASVLAFT